VQLVFDIRGFDLVEIYVEHLIDIPILDEELPEGREIFLVLMEVVVIDDAAGDKDGVQVVSEGIK